MSGSRSSVRARPQAGRGSSASRGSSARRPTMARFEQRRKAGRRRRLLKLAVALLLVAGLGAAGWGVYFGSWFALTKVEVRGTHRLTVTQVEDAARAPFGRPILRVDTGSIERHVAGLTEVSSVRVTTLWPHTVIISVVERTPVAVVRVPGGNYQLVDTDGVDLGGVTVRPDGLPLLSVDLVSTPRATLQAVATVAASLTPALKAKVKWISAVTANSVVLQLSSGASVRWGDSSQGPIKAQVLAALMKRAARVYDVSAPYAPTTARG